MTGTISLPATVAPGPTKPEIRAIVLEKLHIQPTDHVVDVGAGSGAVSIAAGGMAERVTAIERDASRVEAIERNVAANDVPATIEVRHGEAPPALPDRADVLFIGGTQGFKGVLDAVRPMGVRTVVLNAARLETASAAIEAFRDRDLLKDVFRVQIERGYELGGETGFRSDNPVYVVVGSTHVQAQRDDATEGQEVAEQ